MIKKSIEFEVDIIVEENIKDERIDENNINDARKGGLSLVSIFKSIAKVLSRLKLKKILPRLAEEVIKEELSNPKKENKNV